MQLGNFNHTAEFKDRVTFFFFFHFSHTLHSLNIYYLLTIKKKKKKKTPQMDFPGGSDDKESASNEGDPVLIPGLGRSPGEGNGDPPSNLAREFHGQRSLVGYSP